jgi:hypothetical protein
MSVRQYVIATTARDSLTGLSIPGLAGSALVADGAGGATWGSAAAAPTNLLVYVSTTGDNKNDGATALTAVATIDAASAIALRRGWNVSANIRLLPGVHDLAGGRIIRTDGSPGVRMQPLIIESDSLALIGSYSVLSATIVGNLLEITISAPVPAGADGESIRFTSGALNSTRAVVGNVTGSSFTIMYNGATPSPGDTFVLEATTATINILAGAILTGGTRMLRNLRVNLPPQAGGMPPLLLIDMTLFVSGVRFTASTLAGAFVVLSRSTLVSGGNLTSLPGVEANPLGMTLMGFGGMPNVGLLCHGASALSLQGCYFRNAQILATNCSALGAGQSLFQESLCIAVDGACWNLDQSRILNAVNDGMTDLCGYFCFRELRRIHRRVRSASRIRYHLYCAEWQYGCPCRPTGPGCDCRNRYHYYGNR